ncbi:MAG: hypothetical protein DMD41_14960 [Gemmatimonadetes bacterium]|nr:MAG: hypothetical protein DMD41_14960 [Gemmatimonadota bacterium]
MSQDSISGSKNDTRFSADVEDVRIVELEHDDPHILIAAATEPSDHPEPVVMSRCRITNGTSTGFLLGPTCRLNHMMLITGDRADKFT